MWRVNSGAVLIVVLALAAGTTAAQNNSLNIVGQSNGPTGYFDWGDFSSGQVHVEFLPSGSGSSQGFYLEYGILIQDPQFPWAYTNYTGFVTLPAGALVFKDGVPIALNVDTSAVPGAVNLSCYFDGGQQTCNYVQGGRISLAWQPTSGFLGTFSGSRTESSPEFRITSSGSFSYNGCRLTSAAVLGRAAPADAGCQSGSNHNTTISLTFGQ